MFVAAAAAWLVTTSIAVVSLVTGRAPLGILLRRAGAKEFRLQGLSLVVLNAAAAPAIFRFQIGNPDLTLACSSPAQRPVRVIRSTVSV